MATSAPNEAFRPTFNAPILPRGTHLDFTSRHADGTFAAPEASLKSFALINTSPGHVAVARGAHHRSNGKQSVQGISGMAGVGKTTALIGLGHDEDIKTNFIHGVLYMSAGANATEGHMIAELGRIMSITGAISRAVSVQSSKSLEDAVVLAAEWFRGKRVLFLVDDIWPMSTRPEGYLPELEGLLETSPESRIAISTRSVKIAERSALHVDFDARDPYGLTSVAILLAHALPTISHSSAVLESVRPVLQLCAGLPISIAVAGATIGQRAQAEENLASACQEYVKDIEIEKSSKPGAAFLSSAIRVSLSTLSKQHENGWRCIDGTSEYSISDLYVSLCVLENQLFVPVQVLARMWSLSNTNAEEVCQSFHSMSLAKISTELIDGRMQRGLSIHDLHLDFCRESTRQSGEEQTWHRRLLTRHMPIDAFANDHAVFENPSDLRGLNILEYKPREWWRDDVPNKAYIRRNLSRHLRCASLELELGAAILDLRWVMVQAKTGGILRVKNDLDVLTAAVQEKGAFEGFNEPLMSITVISQSLCGIGEILSEGARVASQVFYAHLAGLSETSEWLRLYVKRMCHMIPKPFLIPTVDMYQYPLEEARSLINVHLPSQTGFAYLSTDFSSCYRYCAVGANHDVAVYNLETRSRIKWMKGHEQNVTIVRFSSDASKLVSGSLDKRVRVWGWQETETPHLVLQGHDGAVTSLSLSGDDRQIFSGSRDGTVRIWDMITGRLLREFAYGSEIGSISSCPTNELIAVSTGDGILRCTNTLSGGHVFEYKIQNGDRVSTTAFGPDGSVLLCGTSEGDATSWHTSTWNEVATVSMPGSVTHVSFHRDGADVILGTSQGDIWHWIWSGKELSKYNVSMGRPINGLSFFKNDKEIIASVKNGYARSWSSPKSNPDLDFSDLRNNILFDFDLSADGTRVATSTHDGMIRLWETYSGTQKAAYHAPESGSFRLALNRDGTKIASSCCNGAILVWNPVLPPSDTNIAFEAGKKSASCLSFSPEGSRLLVCLPSRVEIWKLESQSEKLGQISILSSVEACFSADGRFIITGNSNRTVIWDATGRQKSFDSEKTSPQSMSLSEAKNIVRACGPSAHRVWSSSLRNMGSAFTSPQSIQDTESLSVENIRSFFTKVARSPDYQFCKDVLVQNTRGVLLICKLQT